MGLGQVKYHWASSYTCVVGAITVSGILLVSTASEAQLIPDTSLGSERSQVQQSATAGGTTQFIIQQGAIRGKNLFHSFSNFDIPSGDAAYFANPAGVTRILTRITGPSSSQLDGTLGVLGEADLFLLNPQGLNFGPNSRLDLAGSFIGSTANQIQFVDGHRFNAAQPDINPPLTVSVPSGLQMGANAGAIQVQGSGHRLSAADPYLLPYQPETAYTGLQIRPLQTLALLGKALHLDGGVLQAPGGRIELGAVAQAGLIPLQELPQGWSMSYPNIEQFGAIDLTQRASIETGGLFPGEIEIQGGAIRLSEASGVAIVNAGPNVAGDLTVRASESLEVTGLDLVAQIPTQIRQDNLGPGQGGKLLLYSPHLSVQSGASINSRNYGSGPSSELRIEADSLAVQGYSAQAPEAFSRIVVSNLAAGTGGDLFAKATEITVSNGGLLGSATLQAGVQGRNVSIESDRITVKGSSPAGVLSGIGANHLAQVEGRSGNLTLNTNVLEILDGGFVTTTSLAAGDAGDLTVNAHQSIRVQGQSQGPEAVPSSLGSNVYLPPLFVQQLYGLSDIPTGAGGNLQVQTSDLKIEQGGVITVGNFGSGRAGRLQLDAEEILLQDSGFISALTFSGNGGNVNLVANQLVLNNQSGIFATALGAGNEGNGGNIFIDTSLLVGANNSDILASALQGKGGNISITTESLLGLTSSSQITPESDINASSELGLNGTVQIDILTFEPDFQLVELAMTPIDASQLIGVGCAQYEEDQFLISGQGGLPAEPTALLQAPATWRDVEGERSQQKTDSLSPATWSSSRRGNSSLAGLEEATAWKQFSTGQVQLFNQTSAAVFLASTNHCSNRVEQQTAFTE